MPLVLILNLIKYLATPILNGGANDWLWALAWCVIMNGHGNPRRAVFAGWEKNHISEHEGINRQFTREWFLVFIYYWKCSGAWL